MTDIDSTKRRILTSFGSYQMKTNPAGIGNECTHWIYAALFEARALDHDHALHIGQGGMPYTWGRNVAPMAAHPGDIAQFHNFQNQFFVYLPDGTGGMRYMTTSRIRGPNHTGMLFTIPRAGAYYQLESHLHEPHIPLMSIRGNTIYYESFAVALSSSAFNAINGSKAWPSDINRFDIDDLLERVDWVGMRANHSITMHQADTEIEKIVHHQTPSIDGADIAVLCHVRSIGHLRFYCPQRSTARLAMTPAQLATEKADLIHRMIRGGRQGHSPNEDQYGGDNRQRRIHDHRFDWTFPQP
jgi:hypothetical protein